MRRTTGTVGSLELLAGRARKGDRRAAAQLRRRMAPQAGELARALSADPRVVPVIVRQALNDALGDDSRPYTWALVAAVQRRCAAGRTSGGRKHERTAESRLLAAVGVLCDMQGHTHDSAAAALGEPVTRVAALHAQGRSQLGVEGARTHCRGWHLVSRLDELTAPEQEAARRHLASCRPCEEELAARAAARLRLKAGLPVGGTVLTGGVVALFAAVGGGSAGVGAAAVGAAAVLGTAGTVAVAVPPAPPPPPPVPAQVAPAEVAPGEDAESAREGEPDAVTPVPAAPAPGAPAPTAPGVSEPETLDPGSGPQTEPTPAPTSTPPPLSVPTPAEPPVPVPTLPGPVVTSPPPLPALPGLPDVSIPPLGTDVPVVDLGQSAGCTVLVVEVGGGLLAPTDVSLVLGGKDGDPGADKGADEGANVDPPCTETPTPSDPREPTGGGPGVPAGESGKAGKGGKGNGGGHAAGDRETRPQDERLRDQREPRRPVVDLGGLLGR